MIFLSFGIFYVDETLPSCQNTSVLLLASPGVISLDIFSATCLQNWSSGFEREGQEVGSNFKLDAMDYPPPPYRRSAEAIGLSVVAPLAFVVCIPPLIWHWRSRNFPAVY